MAETIPNLSVYVLGQEDMRVGLTGRNEAPIVLVITATNVGLGLPLPVAITLHDDLCKAIVALQDFSDEAKLTSDFLELPKNKQN